MLTPTDKQIVRSMCSDVLNARDDGAESRAIAKLRHLLSSAEPVVERRIVVEIDGRLIADAVVRQARKRPLDLG